ncbi:MAG TPA: hypothetical protein VGM86_29380 [Thermoanaerobaculia bacterium]|jgi:hypothetical protein
MIARTPKSSYADHIKEWEELTAKLAAMAADLPQLELQRTALEKFLAQARDLTLQQADFQASKQKISVQLRTAMTEGMKVATALKVNLKQIFGNRSEDLVKFGIQPFRSRARKVAPAPNPEPTGGSPAPTPPPTNHPAQ